MVSQEAVAVTVAVAGIVAAAVAVTIDYRLLKAFGISYHILRLWLRAHWRRAAKAKTAMRVPEAESSSLFSH
jgi:hypothetical protein